jgi:hypothetical protein
VAQINAAIQRGTQRITAMRPALTGWNNRLATYPAVWAPTGKPVVPAVISNTGGPVPDWPKITGALNA